MIKHLILILLDRKTIEEERKRVIDELTKFYDSRFTYEDLNNIFKKLRKFEDYTFNGNLYNVDPFTFLLSHTFENYKNLHVSLMYALKDDFDSNALSKLISIDDGRYEYDDKYIPSYKYYMVSDYESSKYSLGEIYCELHNYHSFNIDDLDYLDYMTKDEIIDYFKVRNIKKAIK